MSGKTTWILVADGARASVYVNAGPGTGVQPAFDHEFAAPIRNPDRAAGSDKPGRAFDSAGTGRHAMEPEEDWRTHETRAFARFLAERLDLAAQRGEYDSLVVIAPPRFLGHLRQAMGRHARDRLSVEIDKDLTHLDHKHIGKHLEGVVAL